MGDEQEDRVPESISHLLTRQGKVFIIIVDCVTSLTNNDLLQQLSFFPSTRSYSRSPAQMSPPLENSAHFSPQVKRNHSPCGNPMCFVENAITAFSLQSDLSITVERSRVKSEDSTSSAWLCHVQPCGLEQVTYSVNTVLTCL